jgi:hypothetical protein
MHRLKGRLTYGNVIATIALFVALGGSSYAAITLPRNSVGANQIRTGGVRSSEVKDRTLGARDLTVGARRFLKSQEGAQGPQGPQGERGPQGPSGTGGGSVGLTYKTVTGTALPGGDPSGATATCDPGQRVTGGGVRVDNDVDAAARESYPNLGNTAWTGFVGNDENGPDEPGADGPSATFTVIAICTAAA